MGIGFLPDMVQGMRRGSVRPGAVAFFQQGLARVQRPNEDMRDNTERIPYCGK